jgi:oleate hydratase
MTATARPQPNRIDQQPKAYLVGGGIGSLAAAAFMIRDGGLPGGNITILEAAPIMGGSLDGGGDPAAGYSMRGGRMLTTDNYECTWDLYKSIPSLNNIGQTVFDETVEFNKAHQANSMARLVDCRRAKVPVASMGFSMEDRIELLKLSRTDEDTLAASCITDWLSPAFFKTEFWYMWSTTFAFNPGTAPLNSSATCSASCSSFPVLKPLPASNEPSTISTTPWCCPCRPGLRPKASI